MSDAAPEVGSLAKLERDGDEPSPLAGKSTLNRLEHAPGAGKRLRCHKISHGAC